MNVVHLLWRCCRRTISTANCDWIPVSGSADSITAKSKVHSHPWPGRRVAEETLVVTSNLLSRKESHYNVSVQVQLKVKEKLKNTEPTCLREPELPLISHKLKACRSEGTWNIWLYFYLLLVEFSIFIFTPCVWLWELWECHTDSSLQQHSRGLTYDQQLFLICEAVPSAHTHSGLLLCLSPQSQHIRITSECVSKCVCWWRWATVPALSW